jgi:cytochrome d ubiquinol oxidase subunit II
MLDGLDLGVGALYPFLGKSEADKAVMRKSIGPIWDGNEVWLLTAGGALFAAFPPVYATVFSGFYLALMLVLFALIFRAVSLDFRAHDPNWAGVWDWAFFGGSALPALLFGVAVGNIIRGIPLRGGEFAGNFFTLLNPFALIVGVYGLVMFLHQGASWLAVKAEGDLHDRAVKLNSTFQWAFVGMTLVSIVATFLLAPAAAKNIMGVGGLVFGALLLVGLVWGRIAINGKKTMAAWYAASLSSVALVGIWAAAIFPALVPANTDFYNPKVGPGEALTIFNSSSSPLTLTVMLIIAVIGVPLVLFYMYLIYKVFAGKVNAEGAGY